MGRATLTLSYYVGGKLVGVTADFPPSLNHPEFTTFIDSETFTEYILVAGVWQQVGVAPFDDTDLKAYWKFNETSGDIIESSQAAAALGSAADLQVTGATYSDVTSPFGYGLSFNGTNGFAQAGTSLSQFNFMHLAGAAWTVNYWVLEQTGLSFAYFYNTNSIAFPLMI